MNTVAPAFFFAPNPSLPSTRSSIARQLAHLPSTIPAGLNDKLFRRLIRENRRLTLRNARIGAWLAILLVPACSLLDYFAYPQEFVRFLILRLTCSLCCLPLLFGLNRQIGQRYYWLYPVLLPVIPAIFICSMIFLSRDPASPYYAGLTLCIVGASFVFNWTFKEIGLTLAVILVVYLASTLPHLAHGASSRSWGFFINNTAFILLNCVILFASSYHHHRVRMREFAARSMVEQQREQLRVRNTELTGTLQKLRETESQLFHSEKLSSLDRMSSGIIHEINNPLNFTKSALFVLRKKCKSLPAGDREAISRIVADIDEGMDRIASIVADLRGFSHPERQRWESIDVGRCVKTSVRMVRKELRDHQVHLDAEIQEDLRVTGDGNHLVQILINLIQNSISALRGSTEKRIQLTAFQLPTRTEICVLDNGCGIPKEHLGRVFDPFFTTKEVGEGMGLGLNICYRMMKQMRGGIEVRSKPGSYTKFTLWFPSVPGGSQSLEAAA